MKRNTLHLFLFLFTSIFFITDIMPQSFQNGEIGVVLSGAGRVRISKDSTSGVRQIDRSSILVGANENAVFGYNQDAQNVEPVVNIQNPLLSDFEIYGSADNSYENQFFPPNVLSKANVYGWLTGAYTLVKFTIINRETSSIDAYIGMEIIAQINGSYGLESVKWLENENIISIFRPGEDSFVGYKVLSAPTYSVSLIDWYDGYDMVDSDLWKWLTSGKIDTLIDSGGDGAVALFSQNAVNIPSGDSSIVWIGISLGDSEIEMINNINSVQQKYSQITSVESDLSNIPSGFILDQNYPNPFNPSTKISFGLPERSSVVLKVFNTLGEEVAELVNQSLDAGTHSYNFNASGLTSGVYVYTLQTGSNVISKKMTLLK